MSTLQISKMLKRDYRTAKKAANKILYKRNQTKGKDLRTFLIETYDNSVAAPRGGLGGGGGGKDESPHFSPRPIF